LPAHCCQPAVAGGFIFADLWGELSTHLAQQGLFTQSSVHYATATSFPLCKHTGGGGTAPAFSGLRVYLQFTWEVGLPLSPVEFSSHCCFYKLSGFWLLGVCCYPAGRKVCLQLTWEVGLLPLLWTFPPSTTLISFPAPGCWALLPSPARPVLLIYSSARDSPPPLFGAQDTPSSLLCVFIVLIAYYSVSLFSLGGGQSVQGATLIWPRDVCGSTTYHLAHLVVHVFPGHLGVGHWRPPVGPPGFSF
jgi:hypothetical protein